MRRPIAHQIDSSADALIRNVLSDWVVDGLENDYGKDYRVEMQESGKLTGEVFIVQLKGFADAKYVDDGAAVSVTIGTTHVNYFHTSVREPVFLVAVDTSQKVAWWLFVQRYVDEVLEGKEGWREQGTVTLRVPITNAMTSCDDMTSGVRDAIRYMTERNPGTVQAALGASIRSMESLDERFSVDVVAKPGAEHYTVLAKEDVDLRLRLSGRSPDLKPAIDDLINKGRMVNLAERGITLTSQGSPLLDLIANEASVVQVRREISIDLRIWRPANGGNELLYSIAGKLVGGSVEMRFHGRVGDSPLVLTTELRLPKTRHERLRLTVDSSLEFAAWEGRRLLKLSYFRQVNAVLGAVQDSAGLILEGLIEGEQAFGCSVQLNYSRDACETMRFLSAARDIARVAEIDPTIPAGWPVGQSYEEMDQAIELARVINSKGQVSVFGGALSCVLGARETLDLVAEYRGPQPLEVRLPGRRVSLFGLCVEMKGYSASFSEVALAAPCERLIHAASESDDVKVDWVPVTGCTVVEDYSGIRTL